MSTNPYESPSPVDTGAIGVNGGSRQDLRAVAQYQKGIMYCILANVVLIIINIVLRQGAANPGAGIALMSIAISICYLGVIIVQMVFIVMLSIKVYNIGVGIVAGLFSFVPCLGLLILLMVNQKATSVLQANGIKVGLMGADMSQLP